MDVHPRKTEQDDVSERLQISDIKTPSTPALPDPSNIKTAINHYQLKGSNQKRSQEKSLVLSSHHVDAIEASNHTKLKDVKSRFTGTFLLT
jgi:hypothetical protein